jgi:hypothetical protein
MNTYYTLTADRVAIPCFDLLAWASWMESANRRLARDVFGDDEYVISTVFLALDHNFGRTGDPLLFETAIFRPDDVDVLERYRTWAEAAAGHERIRSIAMHEYQETKRLSGAIIRQVMADERVKATPGNT